MTASSSACTPLFLNEAPQSTGTILPAIGRLADGACGSRRCDSSSPARYFSISASSCSTAASISSCRACSTALLEGVGHRHLGERLAERLVVEDDTRPARDHVDVPGESLARADRQLDRERLLASGGPGSSRGSGRSSAPTRSILFAKMMRGTPYRSAWRHTVSVCGSTPATESSSVTAPSSTRSERSTSTVKSTWPGRVDDVDPVHDVVPGPEAGRGGGRDRDAALLLLLHPVHRGRALVHFTDLVVLAGVVEDALGRRRLPGIDVGHDADVPVQFERTLHAPYDPCLWSLFSEKAGRPSRAEPVVSLRARPGFRPRRGVSWSSLAVSSEDQRWLAVVAAVTWPDCLAESTGAQPVHD